MNDTIQILELFGGIGSPRCALRNLNIPTKAIDYVEINEKAVRSYNSMFREELEYKTQTVVGWNLKPDILIHGSPCQDMSIAGHQGKATGDGRINRGKGSDEGSGTRSSLMWETIHIIENMGEWRPRYVIWENVKNVKSKYMRPNFDRYMVEMEKLGYTNNYAVLDAREFGLPQARERVFTVSVLNGEKFEFDDLIRTPMRNLQEFLEDDVPDIYDVTQPSVLACIGGKGIEQAVEYQKEKQRKEKAMQNVAALFGEAAAPEKRCSEGIVNILKAAVEEIYTGGLAKVTLNLRGGVKASISQNSKGEINVERTETKKQKLTE